MSQIKGKVAQVIGPVVDINFEGAGALPAILDAVELVKKDGTVLVLECQQHIGEDL